jgi:phosphoserine phosphatase
MKQEGYLLAAFDMDGTVLKHDSSWAAIHRRFGTESSGALSLKLYGQGKIGYREFMRRDIASWPRGLVRTEIEEILSEYEVREDAPATLQVLRERGLKTALVTSGIDILAEKVAEELRMDYWVANGLRFDSQGRVLSEGVGRVDPRRKDLAYGKLLARLNIPRNRTIAVGDTVYDLAFLKAAGKGFMLAHTTRVPDSQIIHIDRLSEILEHI